MDNSTPVNDNNQAQGNASDVNNAAVQGDAAKSDAIQNNVTQNGATQGEEANGAPLTDEELENLTDEQALDLFVDQLIYDKGMGEMSEDLKNEIHADLKERIIFQINRAIIAQLPDNELDTLNKGLDDGTATEDMINELVAKAGIDTNGIIEDTMLKFRAVYLGEDAGAAEAGKVEA